MAKLCGISSPLILIMTVEADSRREIHPIKLQRSPRNTIELSDLSMEIGDNMKYDAHVVHLPHSTLAIDHPLAPATGRRALPTFHEMFQALAKLRIEIIGKLAAMKKAGRQCGKRLVKFLAIGDPGLDEVVIKVRIELGREFIGRINAVEKKSNGYFGFPAVPDVVDRVIEPETTSGCASCP